MMFLRDLFGEKLRGLREFCNFVGNFSEQARRSAGQ